MDYYKKYIKYKNKYLILKKSLEGGFVCNNGKLIYNYKGKKVNIYCDGNEKDIANEFTFITSCSDEYDKDGCVVEHKDGTKITFKEGKYDNLKDKLIWTYKKE